MLVKIFQDMSDAEFLLLAKRPDYQIEQHIEL